MLRWMAEDPATPAQIRACVRDHGLAGVRISGPQATDGSFPWLSSQAALATWAAANELGLVLDIMTTPPGENPAAIAEFSKLARQFPKVRVVLDHIGWLKNIYCKFSTINIDQLAEAKVSAPDVLPLLAPNAVKLSLANTLAEASLSCTFWAKP
ncbi:MAG: amidohydrolase family protein [Steroidobacteraceae bacterium]